MGAEGSKIGDYVIDRTKPLGKGAFGEVYKGKHVKKAFPVAVKRCAIHSDKHGSLAMKEIKNFQRIPVHKHIVQMMDYEYQDQSFWIVMEYCGRGDLDHYMKRYTPDLDRQLKIMYQCACAVSHMHNQDDPIVHRDIKPGNILFKEEDKKEVVKMADFGLTKALESDGGTAALTTQVGTMAFMAPEVYAGVKYDESVDTFALGLVFLAMINYNATMEALFPLSVSAEEEGELKCIGQEMLNSKLHKKPQPVILKISPLDSEKKKGIKNLILKMTKFEMKDRIKMKDVVEELQSIAKGSVSSKGMVTGQTKQLMLSNLSLAKTKMPSMMSGMGGGLPTVRRVEVPNTVREDDEDDEETVTLTPDEVESTKPDIGYILMRRMLEDHLRKKKEEEIKEKEQREQAERAAAMLPLLALLKLVDSDQESGDKFEIGDLVCVDSDMARAKDLQQDHGGWARGMERYLNEQGRVKDIKDDIVNVNFPDGQSLRFNALLLSKKGVGDKKTARGRLVSGKFKTLDIVKINVDESTLSKLQSGHGGFNKRMKNAIPLRGVVHRVFDDGDVYVEFLNGDKWCINPDALEEVDTSGVPVEAGDIVIVDDDRQKVVKQQEGHGDWVESMAKCLGNSGIVRRVGANGAVAVVEIDDSHWTWNTKSLKLVAKGEEMVLIMLKKQLTGE